MMRRGHKDIGTWIFALSLVMVGLVMPGRAQTNYGAVRGLVSDSQGSVLPNASVSLMNEQTKVVRKSVTNGGGEYLFTALDPGTYTVTISAPAFSKMQQNGILVSIGNTTLWTLS